MALLYTYVLNNSRDMETIDLLVNSLKSKLTESALLELPEGRINNLAKSLKILILQREKKEYKEFE